MSFFGNWKIRSQFLTDSCLYLKVIKRWNTEHWNAVSFLGKQYETLPQKQNIKVKHLVYLDFVTQKSDLNGFLKFQTQMVWTQSSLVYTLILFAQLEVSGGLQVHTKYCICFLKSQGVLHIPVISKTLPWKNKPIWEFIFCFKMWSVALGNCCWCNYTFTNAS